MQNGARPPRRRDSQLQGARGRSTAEQRRTAVKVKWFDTNSSMTSPTGAAAVEHVCPAAPTIAGVACTPIVRPLAPCWFCLLADSIPLPLFATAGSFDVVW